MHSQIAPEPISRRNDRLPVELENERQLIERCQEGDLRAYETVYRQFHQPLLRFALRLLGSREDAEDAVQMTFIKLYRGIDNFRFDARFSTYLMRIAINVCYDVLEKRKRQKMRDLEPVETSYQPQSELHLQLEEAIKTLPERMRECFILFAIEGFKQTEIAAMLDLSVGTVKAHVFQAKEKLRHLLSDPPTEAEA